MKSLRETVQEAVANHKAIGHFNVSNIEGFTAVCLAAQKKNTPVIIGLSEGEREFLGLDIVVRMVQKARERYQISLYLNADHTHSLEAVYEAVQAGCDAVLFDGTGMPWEENIEHTKKAREYVDAYNKKKGTDVLLEAEVGYIGSSSVIFEDIPEGVSFDDSSLTTPQQAEMFVKETGVDLFAPAVGNVHGMYKDKKNPELDIKRIAQIAEQVDAHLVLHGGSGIDDVNMKDAIKAGIGIVHVSTELRVAWKEGIEEAFKKGELAPYKVAMEAQKKMQDVIETKLALYGWN